MCVVVDTCSCNAGQCIPYSLVCYNVNILRRKRLSFVLQDQCLMIFAGDWGSDDAVRVQCSTAQLNTALLSLGCIYLMGWSVWCGLTTDKILGTTFSWSLTGLAGRNELSKCSQGDCRSCSSQKVQVMRNDMSQKRRPRVAQVIRCLLLCHPRGQHVWEGVGRTHPWYTVEGKIAKVLRLKCCLRVQIAPKRTRAASETNVRDSRFVPSWRWICSSMMKQWRLLRDSWGGYWVYARTSLSSLITLREVPPRTPRVFSLDVWTNLLPSCSYDQMLRVVCWVTFGRDECKAVAIVPIRPVWCRDQIIFQGRLWSGSLGSALCVCLWAHQRWKKEFSLLSLWKQYNEHATYLMEDWWWRSGMVIREFSLVHCVRYTWNMTS